MFKHAESEIQLLYFLDYPYLVYPAFDYYPSIRLDNTLNYDKIVKRYFHKILLKPWQLLLYR